MSALVPMSKKSRQDVVTYGGELVRNLSAHFLKIILSPYTPGVESPSFVAKSSSTLSTWVVLCSRLMMHIFVAVPPNLKRLHVGQYPPAAPV